ncbi:MAG: butyrate kinase [Bacteroidales bacterium]|nr:butyrate kinase [Bacteroidales bacterium]
MKSILVIYPEVDITKIAVYRNTSLIFLKSIRHKAEDQAAFADVIDQLEYRTKLIMQELNNNQIELAEITVVMARGGLIKPVKSGIYEVNEAMKKDLRTGVMGRHATNLGGLIGDRIAGMLPNAKAYLADPVVVDEMEPIARVSGIPQIERTSIFHALNHKNVSREYAKSINRKYEDLNLVVAYIGSGGVSVGAHHGGKVVDVNQAFDGDGPFSMTRSGSLPVGQLIDLCYNGKYTREQMRQLITEKGGILAYLGTKSLSQVLSMVDEGDEQATLIMDAMAYQVAKEIGSMSTVLDCKVDAILIMGAIMNSKFFTTQLIRRIEKIAPVSIYPIVNDLDSLAMNGVTIVRGEAEILLYQ